MILHERQATATRDDWHERVEHARSILLIPPAQMPSLAVRRALIQRALHGTVCSACRVDGEWLVWDEQGGAMGGYITPWQWALAHGYLAGQRG